MPGCGSPPPPATAAPTPARSAAPPTFRGSRPSAPARRSGSIEGTVELGATRTNSGKGHGADRGRTFTGASVTPRDRPAAVGRCGVGRQRPVPARRSRPGRGQGQDRAVPPRRDGPGREGPRRVRGRRCGDDPLQQHRLRQPVLRQPLAAGRARRQHRRAADQGVHRLDASRRRRASAPATSPSSRPRRPPPTSRRAARTRRRPTSSSPTSPPPACRSSPATAPYPDPDSTPPGELFQAIAGTSMSSPHVAGYYALLKQAHPDWSAGDGEVGHDDHRRPERPRQRPATPAGPFDMGSGHAEPGQGRRRRARRSIPASSTTPASTTTSRSSAVRTCRRSAILTHVCTASPAPGSPATLPI